MKGSRIMITTQRSLVFSSGNFDFKTSIKAQTIKASGRRLNKINISLNMYDRI